MYKIYKLIYDGVVVYIGRTKSSLAKRKSTGYKSNPELQLIYKDCEMILIEETDDASRESYWIEQFMSDKLLNIIKGHKGDLTKSEYCKIWREKNKEYVKLKKKEYRQRNKKQISEYQSKYHKEYREKNSEKLKEYYRQYYINNKD